MTDFISRVSLDFSCALERIGELGNFFEKTAELIPAQHEAEALVTRFTFCVIKLKADSREECAKVITQAWNRVSPGTSDRIRMITVPFSDGENGRLIREIFGAYYGADDYLKLVAELYVAFPLLTENGSLGALMMQNYLFAIALLLCSARLATFCGGWDSTARRPRKRSGTPSSGWRTKPKAARSAQTI